MRKVSFLNEKLNMESLSMEFLLLHRVSKSNVLFKGIELMNRFVEFSANLQLKVAFSDYCQI